MNIYEIIYWDFPFTACGKTQHVLYTAGFDVRKNRSYLHPSASSVFHGMFFCASVFSFTVRRKMSAWSVTYLRSSLQLFTPQTSSAVPSSARISLVGEMSLRFHLTVIFSQSWPTSESFWRKKLFQFSYIAFTVENKLQLPVDHSSLEVFALASVLIILTRFLGVWLFTWLQSCIPLIRETLFLPLLSIICL